MFSWYTNVCVCARARVHMRDSMCICPCVGGGLCICQTALVRTSCRDIFLPSIVWNWENELKSTGLSTSPCA